MFLAIFVFAQFDQDIIPQASAEEIFVALHFAPSVVETREGTHSIGFVNIVNSNGEPVLAEEDIEITLVSKNPSVATVVPKVVIPEGRHYANFDVTLGNTSGNAEISAVFEDQTVSQNLIVGDTHTTFPDDLRLEITTPATEMHVNTEMPLSVFLKSSSGNIVPAAEDLVITFDYEQSLIKPAEDKIIIKKGDYYGITTITSLEELGNSFIRATAAGINLSSVTNIKISSVQDSRLQLHIFPDRVTEFNDRGIEIFAGVEDADGLSTVATKDITIKISADDESLSERIKSALENKQPIIKKGQYGFHLQPNMIFSNLPENYTISVSSDNYQGVSKLFDIVKPMEPTDAKAKNKAVKVFVPPVLPIGAKAIAVYQTGAIEEDDDDPETEIDDEIDEEINIREIDDLKDGEIFPVQSGMKFTSKGSAANMKITSSDNSILEIVNAGGIGGTEGLSIQNGYGVAIIKTGQKTGDVTISVTLDGWGLGTAKTSVVNPIEPTQTVIFSPVASNKILLDEEGKFELLFLPLDVAKRPTSSENAIKYLIKPINELIEIQPQKNFVRTQFFAGSVLTSNFTTLNAVQVGIDSNIKLETTTNFEITPTSTVKVILPFERIVGANQINPIGTVQLTDFYGNPIQTTKNLSVVLSSSNEQVLTVPKTVTIPTGSSYVNFPITTTPDTADIITIYSNAKNMQGSTTQLSVESLSKQLKLFAQYPETQIDPGQDINVKVFVDDEKARPVKDALIILTTSDGAQAIPDRLTTSNNGEASFIFKTKSGPTAAFTIKASKVGYEDAKKTLELQVRSSSEEVFDKDILEFPPTVIYVAVGLAAVTAGAVVYFIIIKPRQKPIEEEEI